MEMENIITFGNFQIGDWWTGEIDYDWDYSMPNKRYEKKLGNHDQNINLDIKIIKNEGIIDFYQNNEKVSSSSANFNNFTIDKIAIKFWRTTSYGATDLPMYLKELYIGPIRE